VVGVGAFQLDDELTHPLDFLLLQNGPIVLVGDDAETLFSGLARLGYDIVQFDAGSWTDPAEMHQDLAARLNFPVYYGHNLAALRDCLSDVATGQYGWSLAATGLAVVLRSFDAFHARHPDTAEALLDAAAGDARYGMLFGHRLLWLLEVPAGYQVPPTGAFAPTRAYAQWVQSE
jgi:hypothetical protein